MVSTLALRMWITFQDFLSPGEDEDGQTLAEYGLIISAIAVAAAITAVIAFRGALAGAFDSATDCLNHTTCPGS